MLQVFCYRFRQAATGTAAVLLIGTAGLLRGLSHDTAAVAQVERAASREVPEASEAAAMVRRCWPVVLDEDDHGVRAVRCHVAPSEVEKSR